MNWLLKIAAKSSHVLWEYGQSPVAKIGTIKTYQLQVQTLIR